MICSDWPIWKYSESAGYFWATDLEVVAALVELVDLGKSLSGTGCCLPQPDMPDPLTLSNELYIISGLVKIIFWVPS